MVASSILGNVRLTARLGQKCDIEQLYIGSHNCILRNQISDNNPLLRNSNIFVGLKADAITCSSCIPIPIAKVSWWNCAVKHLLMISGVINSLTYPSHCCIHSKFVCIGNDLQIISWSYRMAIDIKLPFIDLLFAIVPVMSRIQHQNIKFRKVVP